MNYWKLTLLILLLAVLSPTVEAQVVRRPVPLTLDRRAMVYPDDSVEWGYLSGADITILNNFGPSAEVAATAGKINSLRNQGVTLHQLPKVDRLFLRTSTVDPSAFPIDPATHPQITTFPGESHPLIVSMTGVWQAGWTSQLQSVGAQIIGAMPPYGALIHLPINNLSALEALPFVYGVMYCDPVERLAPRLGTSVSSQSFTGEILIFDGFSSSRVQGALGGSTVTNIDGRQLVTGTITVASALALANYPEVEWIDDWDPGSTYNEKMRVLVQTENKHTSANQAFYNPIYWMGVDGSTETIAISDTGIRTTPFMHEVLMGPGKIALEYVPNGSGGTLGDEFGHGSAVTCSAIGDVLGTSSGMYGTANKFDGLAFNASLIMQDIGNSVDGVSLPDDWINEVFVRAYNEGARVQNSSWGHGNSNVNFSDGTYSFRTQLIDKFLKRPEYYDSVQVFAVGNNGGDHTTFPPNITYQPNSLSDESHAKNAISVGGHRNGDSRNIMYSYSSRGPTNDGIQVGRVKPDLVSVGSTLYTADEWATDAYWTWFGTSHAAPCVSAASALIRDWFNKGFYTGPAILGPEPSSALIKAMLINSTVFQGHDSAFLGNAAAGLPADGYPNFDQGYGRPVLDTVLDPQQYRKVKLFENATTQVVTGERWIKTVNLKNHWPDSPCNSLRVTLAWTDEAMSLPSGRALVNDLDLQVTFLGQKYIGNALHKQNGRFDGKNNIEDIMVPIMDGMVVPQNFTIQVDVLGTKVFADIDQPFAVVVTYGACPGTLPCDVPGPCYPGPGDTVPTPNPPPSLCGQDYSEDEYEGGDPDPQCDPPGPIIVDPADPTDPEPVDG